MSSSSIFRKIEVFFHFQKIEVVFHFQKKMRLSSTFKNCRSSSIFHLVGLKRCCIPKISFLGWLEQNWGRLQFEDKKGGRLPLEKNLEVVFHISSSWVKIRLHTKIQLLGLSRTKLRSSSIWKNLSRLPLRKNLGRLPYFI